MMQLFQQYNVEFISSTEKFDTSTPLGRAMLNICIVFAQLERETIQKRVADENVKLLYDMYAQPEVSLGDVARHFHELNIYFHKGEIQRSHISKLLRNPVYVQADMDVYEF